MNIKKLSIVFLIILFLFIFTTSSSATITVTHNGEEVELPDLPVDDRVTSQMYVNLPYIVAYGGYRETYCFYIPTEYIDEAVITYKGSGEPWKGTQYLYYKVPGSDSSSDTCSFYGYSYDSSSDEWDPISSTFVALNDRADTNTILYSNKAIYENDGEDVFFQLTPVLTELGEIVKEAQPQEVMNQILAILGTILAVVVSFLGLRKALRMLSKLLHQA